jgi:hypothetical protein
MEQSTVYTLAVKLIETQEKHRDYIHVTTLADKYRRHITGEGLAAELIQIVTRESLEVFQQRLRLTEFINPAVCSSLMQPFDKPTRSNKVKRRFDFGDETLNEAIQGMREKFYGDQFSEDKGLDAWTQERFKFTTFLDPNAWVVTEWHTDNDATVPVAHPFEVSAENAWNYNIKQNVLRWLWVHEMVTIRYIASDGTVQERDGHKYTIYEEDNTIVFCEVCRKLLDQEGGLVDNQELYSAKNEIDYVVSYYDPKLGYVPAKRIGYLPDASTNGRTFVNPFHVSMCFLKKALTTVSELDITMINHAFPQKIQYVERCEGESRQKKCLMGKVAGTTDKCKVCDGKGYKIHTSAQDVILLPFPENTKDAPAMSLDNILIYKSPPVDLVKWQSEYADKLTTKAYLAMYNNQMFLQPTIAATATQVDTNTEGIYDVLKPYTDKISQLWKFFVYTFARLAGIDDPDAGTIIHKYPADFKLKGMTALLGDLKTANESGATTVLIDSINDDIAEIVYEGDPIGYDKYLMKKKFYPFNGKTPDEVAVLMTSEYISKFDKILWANFESIFTEIDAENKTFWWMQNLTEQWAIVEKKVAEFSEQLTTDAPRIIVMGADTPGLPNSATSEAGPSNGGEGNEDIPAGEGAPIIELSTVEE